MSTGRGTRLLLVLIFLALGASLGRRLDVVEVRGRSMSPALLPGDRLIAVRAPGRSGDVVLAPDPRDPGRELIKRVTAVSDSGVILRGDNPAASTDARTFGALSPAEVRWRVVARYWPPGRFGLVSRSQIMDPDGPAQDWQQGAERMTPDGRCARDRRPPVQ